MAIWIADARISRACRRRLSRLATVVAVALLVAGSARSAQAGFTEALPTKYGEPEQGQILSHVLGGTFTASGDNFSNGTITATQLDDSADQTWTGSIISAQAVAAFSQLPEVFGYIPGADSSGFTPLFTASGHGYDVTGSSGAVPITDSYQLARDGPNALFSSDPANSADQSVHMLAYAVTGLPNQLPTVQTWMLFWEDTAAPASDWDYNDLVVELQTDPPAPSTTPLLIPLPPAVWSGLSGLVALLVVAGIGRYRRAQLA
ncbi:MAG TPA: hypothetical protein VHY37_12065 [Tepidisphaeraceae bacterium]|nr:hypothetical protein [Tepidisphaeraceae bacterium]